MKLEQIRAYLDAAYTLNFTKTAQRMNVSQSTVSKYICDLERKLDTPLFDRSGGRVSLTQAGDALIPWANQLAAEFERFHLMASSVNDKVVGNLRIACTTSAGKYLLPMLAVRFRARFPDVDVSMLACQPPDVDKMLRIQQADLAVVSFELSDPELECQVFFYDKIILIAPPNHPLVYKEEVFPEDLLTVPMLIREPTSGTRRSVLAMLSSHSISLQDLNILLELANAEAIVASVASELGIAFISSASANFALAAGRVVKLSIPELIIKRKICMLRKKFQPSRRPAELFWGFIHEPENKALIRKFEL